MYTQPFNVPDGPGNLGPAADLKPVLCAQEQQLLAQAQTRFDAVIDACWALHLIATLLDPVVVLHPALYPIPTL